LVVVGAGPAGAFAALAAALRGERVTLVDPRGILGGAASRSAGVLTVQLDDPLDVRLVVRSIELIRSVSRSSIVPTGFLQIGREEGLSDSVEAMREAGVEHEVLTAEEIVERWPVFRVDDDLIGIYTSMDLSVEPPLLGAELGEALASLGVEAIRRSVITFKTDRGAIDELVLENGTADVVRDACPRLVDSKWTFLENFVRSLPLACSSFRFKPRLTIEKVPTPSSAITSSGPSWTPPALTDGPRSRSSTSSWSVYLNPVALRPSVN
jgi:hypothetical protein